jgi:hypothetical protein
MAFRGKESVRSKTCINNRIFEQVITVNYLERNISYEGEKDLNMKTTSFVKVVTVVNQIFKPPLVFRHTRIQIYKIPARETLSYGSEEQIIIRMTTGEWYQQKCSSRGGLQDTPSQTTKETNKLLKNYTLHKEQNL